jgi:N-acetylmuramoyl-L-alanine amidase
MAAVLAGCSSAPRHQTDFTMVQEPETVVIEPSENAPPAPIPVPPPASERPAARPPSSPQTNHFTETWIPLDRWCRGNGYGAPQRTSTDVPPAYSIAISNNVLHLRVGSRTAYWNGLEFLLGFAPQIVDGHPCVHSLDVRKNFEPLISPHLSALKPTGVIVIDPGHGGTDTGAKSVYNGHFEKEFTLDVARRLQRLLATNGWTVLMTRNDDLNLALSNRVNFAEQHKADLFLSLHFNSAAPDREQAGLETYCLTPTGMPSNLTRGYHDYPGLIFPNNGFDTQNLEYAMRLHRAVLKVNGRLDRGVRRARFLGVLQNQNRPAVLVECGYLSNPREARQIADPSYREKLAEALAGAVLESPPSGINLASQPAASPSIKEEKTN